jgi:4-oxalomesaconate tautomerase
VPTVWIPTYGRTGEVGDPRMLTPIPCTLMRGGTSKGLYFDAKDLPRDRDTRDRVLLAAMGSPDARQIDGVGGAHPLTSKVAVISRSTRADADVDYLFLQVVVDKMEVSDSQNCGNILAGVGPWAIENEFVKAAGDVTPIRIHMVNTGSIAIAHVQTPKGLVEYEGNARIDGVPGTAAPIPTDFLDVAGSSCGALLPTGSVVDVVEGIEVTCIDNGMPVVIIRAADLGKTGEEAPEALEADSALRSRIEKIRLALGPRMNLGDVTRKTVPKLSLVSKARHGGVISTRTFIPHRVHEAIGVLGAVSVATACVLPGSVAAKVAEIDNPQTLKQLDVEHPTGFFTVDMDVSCEHGEFTVRRSALLRTARKLMSGQVFVPARVWSGR